MFLTNRVNIDIHTNMVDETIVEGQRGQEHSQGEPVVEAVVDSPFEDEHTRRLEGFLTSLRNLDACGTDDQRQRQETVAPVLNWGDRFRVLEVGDVQVKRCAQNPKPLIARIERALGEYRAEQTAQVQAAVQTEEQGISTNSD